MCKVCYTCTFHCRLQVQSVAALCHQLHLNIHSPSHPPSHTLQLILLHSTLPTLWGTRPHLLMDTQDIIPHLYLLLGITPQLVTLVTRYHLQQVTLATSLHLYLVTLVTKLLHPRGVMLVSRLHQHLVTMATNLHLLSNLDNVL